MCLTITPSMVQLVAWPLSGARPKSESEVCSFCWSIPSELCTFECNYVALYFLLMDISLVSHLNELKHENFVLPTQWLWILLRWSKHNVYLFMHIVTLLIIVVLKIKYSWILNPESWILSAPDGPHVDPMNLAIRDVNIPGIGLVVTEDPFFSFSVRESFGMV